MPKKQPAVLHEDEFQDWMATESAQTAAADFLHGINLYVNSALELTNCQKSM